MPTEKQKKAFVEIVENGRNKGDAMVKAGYSENTSKAPTKLTDSKGWEELCDKYLPDEDLTRIHKEGLQAGKKIFKNNNATNKVEEVGFEADYPTRHRYLDLAYKVKGKLTERLDITTLGDKINKTDVQAKIKNLSESS